MLLAVWLRVTRSVCICGAVCVLPWLAVVALVVCSCGCAVVMRKAKFCKIGLTKVDAVHDNVIPGIYLV